MSPIAASGGENDPDDVLRALFDQMAAELAKRRRRGDGRRGDGTSPTFLPAPDSQEPDAFTRSIVTNALDDLARAHPRAAETVRLRAILGMPIPEVAKTLGVSESIVKSEWNFARAWLHPAIDRAE